MATWGNYQSVVQLGAALNFAFGALEAISKQPLLSLARRTRRKLRELKQQGIAAARDVDLVAVDVARRAEATVTMTVVAFERLNPFMFTMFGVIGIGQLVYASEMSDLELTTIEKTLIVLAGYGWFAAFLTTQLGLRIFIELILKHVAGEQMI